MKTIILWMGICLSATSVLGAEDVKPPVMSEARTEFLDALLAPATYLSMSISPDGKRIAAIIQKKYVNQQWKVELKGDEVNTGLVLIDLDTMQPKLIVPTTATGSGTGLRSPLAVHWVADDLMVVDFSNNGFPESDSINLLGARVASLGAGFSEFLPERGHKGDWIVERMPTLTPTIRRVNARTGAFIDYDIDLPGKLSSFSFDDKGSLRTVTMVERPILRGDTTRTHWYRPDEQSAWQKLETFKITEDAWYPLHALPETDTLMIASRRGRDTWAIFAYDVKKHEQTELLAGSPTDELHLSDSFVKSEFDSVATLGMKPVRHWFEANWAAAQAATDTALPNKTNQISGNPKDRVLVFSYSDVDPGEWLVMDMHAHTLQPIAQVNGQVDPKRMRPKQTIDYVARDGLLLHGYLTLPAQAGAAAPPMVVLIHGGPAARDTWDFDPEVQWLAFNGYAVFQPQFRGSTGFGKQYEEAGYRQWGLAMQDDITDGVKYLTGRGTADPARVCISGASYGGYAALWGVIKTPELYRCSVSFAGVSDLQAQLEGWFNSDLTSVGQEFERSRVGDLSKSGKDIDAVSPIKHIEQIKRPLLIAHGEWDSRVPYAQSERLVHGLKEAGKDVLWLSYPREGHGLTVPEHRRSYYASMVGFLDKYIGPSGSASKVDTSSPAASASLP